MFGEGVFLEKNIGEGKYSDGDEEKKNVEGKEGKYLEKDNTFVGVGVGLLKWFNLKM